MKKQIACTLVGLVAYVSSGVALGQGQIKAPEFKPEHYQGAKDWRSKDWSKMGIINYYDRDKDGVTDLSEAILTCDGIPMKHAFGVYDFNTNKLYLDKEADGIIDQVTSHLEGRVISDDAPDCH